MLHFGAGTKLTMAYQPSDLASWSSALWDDPSELRQCHILQDSVLQLECGHVDLLWFSDLVVGEGGRLRRLKAS